MKNTALVLAACATLASCAAEPARSTMIATPQPTSPSGSPPGSTEPPGPRRLDIELLYLDVTTCGRCKGTDANLESALGDVKRLLVEAGAEVNLTKVHVDTAGLAREHRFVSSPTIRINGRDAALELRESDCADCGEIAGCGGGVDCRVWVWQGREFTQAPRGMIIDAVLREAYGPAPRAQPAGEYVLPENLRRFYEATASTCGDACCGAATAAPCCSSEGIDADRGR